MGRRGKHGCHIQIFLDCGLPIFWYWVWKKAHGSPSARKTQDSLIMWVHLKIKWATSWQNLLLPHANNKGTDQPAHPRSLISTFVVRCLDSLIPLVSISEISSLQLASVAAEAGLNLTWSQTPKTGFLVTRLKQYQTSEKIAVTILNPKI